jgi:multidrug efflux system membrane fusion protein
MAAAQHSTDYSGKARGFKLLMRFYSDGSSVRGAWILFFCIVISSLGWQGCNRSTPAPARPTKRGEGGGAVPVTVAKAVQKDVPIDVRVVGTVEAYLTVTVKAQVSGELTKVLFKEGDFVKKGDPLFTVDSRLYEAQLNQVRANLAKDEAVLAQIEANLARDNAQEKYSQSEASRYSSLYENNLVSKGQMEQVRANEEAVAAAVRADQAAIRSARATVEATRASVENAKLMLGYTTIYSPLNGRTGNLDVKQGNVINPNTSLMTINQVEPIYVTFSVPEAQLPRIKKSQQVMVSTQNDSASPQIGELTFIDNTVDSTTGTIRLKGTFPNPDHKLWPGEFVRVTLRLATQKNAIVVPNQAVQTGQEGSYVFVVKQDRTVESRPVVTGARVDQDLVIDKGLVAGDIVVTEGQLRLAPGSRIQLPGEGGQRGGRSGPGGRGASGGQGGPKGDSRSGRPQPKGEELP